MQPVSRLEAEPRNESKSENPKTVELAGGYESSGNFMQPIGANVYVGFATTPGQIATIHKESGSTFNKKLAEYLRHHYQTMHVEEIFQSVTRAVSDKVSHVRGSDGSIKEFMQIPERRSTLRKYLYFTSQPKIKVILALLIFLANLCNYTV